MNRIVKAIVAGVVIVMCSGCSMLNYNACKKDYVQQKAMERAVASGDQNVIKGVVRGDYVGLGADLLDPALIDVLSTHPIRSVAAGVADLGTLIGGGWALTRNSSHTSTTSVTVNGNGNTTSYNNGNGNTVQNNPSTDSHNAP